MSYTRFPAAPVIGWTKYSVTHVAMRAAALTSNITLFTLAPKHVVHKIILKPSVAFAGTGITAYTISLGIAGTLDKYIAAFDVLQAVAATTFGLSAASVNATPESFSAGVAVKIAATAVDANLDQSTAGTLDIYVLTSHLP